MRSGNIPRALLSRFVFLIVLVILPVHYCEFYQDVEPGRRLDMAGSYDEISRRLFLEAEKAAEESRTRRENVNRLPGYSPNLPWEYASYLNVLEREKEKEILEALLENPSLLEDAIESSRAVRTKIPSPKLSFPERYETPVDQFEPVRTADQRFQDYVEPRVPIRNIFRNEKKPRYPERNRDRSDPLIRIMSRSESDDEDENYPVGYRIADQPFPLELEEKLARMNAAGTRDLDQGRRELEEAGDLDQGHRELEAARNLDQGRREPEEARDLDQGHRELEEARDLDQGRREPEETRDLDQGHRELEEASDLDQGRREPEEARDLDQGRREPEEGREDLEEPIPDFTYRLDDPVSEENPFAVKPNDPRYYEKSSTIQDKSTTTKNEDGESSGNVEFASSRDYSDVTHRDKFSMVKSLSEPRRTDNDSGLVSSSPIMNNDIYFIAIVAGCSAAAMFALVLIGLTWCRLQRGAKAAADIEYPAYGVTGPNKDVSPSGDQRLAHSAQMYHFQHQKQQIIAMENRTASSRDPGSVSEAESDEENEEGDYTVYECPGLASAGEMEVKNPMFHDDPTSATSPQVNHNKEEDHI